MSICCRCNKDAIYCHCRDGFLPLGADEDECKQIAKDAKKAAKRAMKKVKKILFS